MSRGARRQLGRPVLPDPLPVPRVTRLRSHRLAAPPSKSVTNRALVLAALADGRSVLERPLHSEDTAVMVRALAQLGVAISVRRGEIVEVEGTAGRLSPPREPLDVMASGTALRFLTAVATLVPGAVVLTGQPRLRERPMADLVIALRRLGVQVSTRGVRGRPPVEVAGGGFPGGRVRLRGKVSSQFASALLMLGPYGRTDLELSMRRPTVSEPYVGLTCDLMRRFGAEVEADPGGLRLRVRARGPYGARRFAVEGDASSASYFLALGAMTGERITVTNLDPATAQGDIGFVDILALMGCQVTRGTEGITVSGGDLQGAEVDMVAMPDLVPSLAVVALFAKGVTRIRNVGNLRLKESDRLSALAIELGKVGARVRELPDGLHIDPARAREPTPALIETYRDHRVAMSFAVLGAARGGIAIRDPRVVTKSYPAFWEDLRAITGARW